MKHLLLALLMVIFCSVPINANKPKPKPTAKPDKTLSNLSFTTIVKPKTRLTSKWAFVIDTSSSTWKVFTKTRKAFVEVTSYPTDELEFSMYTFNHKNNERYRGWTWASEKEFIKADKWVYNPKNRGVLSYGARAIQWAIKGMAPIIDKYGIIRGMGPHDTRVRLTVIIITDGGFTENRRTNDATDIRNAIESAQRWRIKHGYPRALIATVGIENLYYRANHKRPDAACQKDLKLIGIEGQGGYYYLKKIKS